MRLQQMQTRHHASGGGGGSNPIAYSTGANPGTNPTNNGFPSPLPLSAANSAGQATSPLGWTVDAFDDFNGTKTNVTISGYSAGGFTTGATFAGTGQPMLYGFLGQAHWGGRGGTDTPSNISMANSLLTFKVTTNGSGNANILTSSYIQWVNTPWGYWEFSVRAQHGADGQKGGECNIGIWFSGSNWPSQGEFDLIESGTGVSTSGGISSNIHIGPTNSDHGSNAVMAANPLAGGGTWDDGNFHVYGWLCTPSYLAVYTNGSLVGWSNSSTWLNNLSTATDPPFSTGTNGSFGFKANQLSGSESQIVNSGNFFQVLVGYETTSTSTPTSMAPTQMDLDWWRHSKLFPASGGPHV